LFGWTTAGGLLEECLRGLPRCIKILRERVISTERAAVSGVGYSTLGSPLPPASGSSGVTENSFQHFHVIGHIVGVSRQEDPSLASADSD